MELSLNPRKGTIGCTAKVTLVNRSETTENTFYFMLNPGLELASLAVDGDMRHTYQRTGPLIELTFTSQRHERNEETFVENLSPVRRHADPADIDNMTSAREEGRQLAVSERRRDYGKIMQMTRALPGVIGDVAVAFLHGVWRKPIDEMTNRQRH